MQNNDIVRALETIATLMEIKDEAYYRVLGYQRAAESVAALGRRATEGGHRLGGQLVAEHTVVRFVFDLHERSDRL